MELSPELLRKLESVLDSVEQMLPRSADVQLDWSIHMGAVWTEHWLGGFLSPVETIEEIALSDLLGMDIQMHKVAQNTKQLVAGWPANNVLLWGSRGTGKSSLVRALLNEYCNDGLRLIQVDKQQLQHLPTIVGAIKEEPYKFILFCDDLAFNETEANYKELKSALDGALFSLPDNIVIYATSNRRHLLPEYQSENQQAKMVDGQIHHGDAIEEKVSLSDRFGVWVSFYPINQEFYLQIAQHWTEKLALQWQDNKPIKTVWNEQARAEALRWALGRGTRSGRTAYQFARYWIGKTLMK